MKAERVELGAEGPVFARVGVAFVDALLTLQTGATLRARATVAERSHGQTLAGNAGRAAAVIGLDFTV